MSQLALALDTPISGNHRRTDPISSVAAGRRCNAEGERARIRACLQTARRALTVAQIVERTGIPRDHVASRLPVMARNGQARLVGLVANNRGHEVQEWEFVL